MSYNVILIALLLGSANCFSQLHFPSSSSSSSVGSSSSSASSSSSSSSVSNSPSDHEESEQVQAFVIAEPQSSSSENDEVSSSVSSNSLDSSSSDSTSSSSSSSSGMSSALPILINLALNNMAGTMSHGAGGPIFRSSRDPCSGCGCKCSHGSQSILCQLCAQRGYRSSPCPCAGSSSSSSSTGLSSSYGASTAYMTPSASYYYPIYYDAVTGLPVTSASSRYSTYSRSPYISGNSMRMAASYVVPSYASPPTAAAASSYVPVATYASPYSSYHASASYAYPMIARLPYESSYSSYPYASNSFARRSSSPSAAASSASWFIAPQVSLASQFIPLRYYSPYSPYTMY